MSGVSYREATAEDAECISNLILESQEEFCFHEYSEDGKKLMLHLCGVDAIRSYIVRGDSYYVAECDGDFVGVAGVRDNEHLSHNFVDKNWHRQGISNNLWKLVSDECIRRGNNGSFNLNASTYAIPVYERWGFKVTGAMSHEHGLSFTPMELNPE
jgi:GNAT superfamily N-acetyltransferase